MMEDIAVLPAPSTKHIATLHTRLPRGDSVTLRQQAVEASGSRLGTTGTTLWLGAQVLSAYLNVAISAKGDDDGSRASNGGLKAASNGPNGTGDAKPKPKSRRPRALELGAGVGYLALTVASLGYDVTTTDIEPVLSRVLAPNVAVAPRGGGVIEARELDWFDAVDPPSKNTDTSPQHLPPEPTSASTASSLPSTHPQPSLTLLDEEYDMVVTTDTIYAPNMTPALWAAIERVCAPRKGRRTPTLYIALERRDPRVVDAALEMGRSKGCTLRRIAQGRLVKALERAGWHWKPEDWEGVEVWKGKWR